MLTRTVALDSLDEVAHRAVVLSMTVTLAGMPSTRHSMLDAKKPVPCTIRSVYVSHSTELSYRQICVICVHEGVTTLEATNPTGGVTLEPKAKVAVGVEAIAWTSLFWRLAVSAAKCMVVIVMPLALIVSVA